MRHGWIKVTALSHALTVGDPQANARALVAGIASSQQADSRIVVTPALGLTGCTLGDLTLQSTALQAAEAALAYVLEETNAYDVLALVGLPIGRDGAVYNAAAVIKGGRILGVAAKRILRASEARLFASAPETVETITLCGQTVPFGGTQVFACANVSDLVVGVEFGEELEAIGAPHDALALGGATLICNMAATPTYYGAAEKRLESVKAVSRICHAAYVYVDTVKESTTDYVYGGQKIIALCGDVLAYGAPFEQEAVSAVVDVAGAQFVRRKERPVSQRPSHVAGVSFAFDAIEDTQPPRVSTLPFVPEDAAERARLAADTLRLQAEGLAARATRIGAKHFVLGVSGGLDSTLALLVCKEACALMSKKPAEYIIGVTLPCFGTTAKTKNNAQALCEALGITCQEINIADAVTQHLKDIGHADDQHDVAFENAQARMRTMVLMDLANAQGGIVVGTGDLSETALGWCTYNGDHMSMYNVNGTVPKTRIQCIVAEIAKADESESGALAKVLNDILSTPISPELLPPKNGEITQKTEEVVGRYEINDFILYYMMTWGMSPAKIYRLAVAAFGNANLKEAFLRFYHRFFSQQFKRSCSVDGAKVGEVDLSPRGEWQMPSDVTAAAWLAELDAI